MFRQCILTERIRQFMIIQNVRNLKRIGNVYLHEGFANLQSYRTSEIWSIQEIYTWLEDLSILNYTERHALPTYRNVNLHTKHLSTYDLTERHKLIERDMQDITYSSRDVGERETASELESERARKRERERERERETYTEKEREKCIHIHMQLIYTICINCAYGVATISTLLKITGLFCERDLQKSQCSAKRTNVLKEPTNRSHILIVATPYLHFIWYDSPIAFPCCICVWGGFN